jgi:hypothetical protein
MYFRTARSPILGSVLQLMADRDQVFMVFLGVLNMMIDYLNGTYS